MAMAHQTVFRRIIRTPFAPQPVGPYSQAVLVNHTLYLAGQIGMDPFTSQLVSGGAVAEARQALINIGKILEIAGCTYNNVMKCTVLLTNMDEYQAVNEVYKEFFPQQFPARVAYQVVRLPAGAKVEIEATAVVGGIRDAQ